MEDSTTFVYVQKTLFPDGSEGSVLKAAFDNEIVYVPKDPANRHYAEILRQVEAGTLVIQEADNGAE